MSLYNVMSEFSCFLGAPILFSEIGFCMASCSYICMYVCMYVCMYIYICQDGGAVDFVDFTKLSFADTKTTASAVSFSAIFACEISDFGQQLSV